MAAALIAVAAVAMSTDTAAAQAEPAFTVQVVRDLDADGRQTPDREFGVAGVTVRVTAFGRRDPVDYTTGDDGTVRVPLSLAPRERQFRVELLTQSLPDGLEVGFTGEELSSRLAFVEADESTVVKFGVWRPKDFCSVRSDLTTPCQVAMNKAGDVRTIVAFNNEWRGDHFGVPPQAQSPTTLATKDETGTLYGMAYSRERRWIYSGAYAKRYTTYGPAGPGGIYLTPRDGAPGQTTVFATLDAGSTQHSDARFDNEFIGAVGRESLGDVELSEDGTELYVVNLFDRRLYTFDATRESADAPLAAADIPDPGCVSADDWRPMGLGFRDGVLYVGGVCSAESTQDAADLRAVVLTYDPAARRFNAGTVVDHGLTYARGYVYWSGNPGKWNPWTRPDPNQFPKGPNGEWGRPEPMLSDIEVEANGDLVLGFRDRFADLGGFQMINPNPANGDIDTTGSGGDMIRVCRAAPDAFVWEGSRADCATNTTQGHEEFYAGDDYGAIHQETAQGALALSYADSKIVSTHMDPANAYFVDGVGWHDRATGRRQPHVDGYGFQHINSPVDGGFGKANGLGDLEFLCSEPPIQIGNRVWYDRKEGSQNPSEPYGVQGVTVTLLDEAGTVIAETKTNAKGEYAFSSEDHPAIRPFTRYVVRFDRSTANYDSLPLDYPDASQVRWTRYRPIAEWNLRDITEETNSDAVPDDDDVWSNTATAEVTTGDWGSVHHDIDAGIVEDA